LARLSFHKSWKFIFTLKVFILLALHKQYLSYKVLCEYLALYLQGR
jgi:hypothetical protein